MLKKPVTITRGISLDHAKLKTVWNTGVPIIGYDAEIWRRDHLGHIIRFDDYKDEESAYGWRVDHIRPISMKGFDGPSILEPTYWKTTFMKNERSQVFDETPKIQGW